MEGSSSSSTGIEGSSTAIAVYLQIASSRIPCWRCNSESGKTITWDVNRDRYYCEPCWDSRADWLD